METISLIMAQQYREDQKKSLRPQILFLVSLVGSDVQDKNSAFVFGTMKTQMNKFAQ